MAQFYPRTQQQESLAAHADIPAGQIGSPWTAAPVTPVVAKPEPGQQGFQNPGVDASQTPQNSNPVFTGQGPMPIDVATGKSVPNPTIYGRGNSTPTPVIPGLTSNESGQYNSSLNTLGTPITVSGQLKNESELLAGRRAQAEDSINKIMAGENARVTAAQKNAEYAAAASGMMGTPGAGKAIEEQVGPVRDQATGELAKILLGIDSQAQSDANLLQQQEQARASGDLETLNTIAKARTDLQATAKSTFDQLSKTPGIDYKSFSESPYGQQLLEQAGLDSFSGSIIFNANQQQAGKLNFVTSQYDDNTGTLNVISQDANGKLVQQQFKMAGDVPSGLDLNTAKDDGTGKLLIQPKRFVGDPSTYPSQIWVYDPISRQFTTLDKYQQSGSNSPSQPGQQGQAGQSGSVSFRTNNPGNIKWGKFAESLGATDSGIHAKDGGSFALFPSVEAGQAAQKQLLQSPNYANLTLDAAMKRWSNSGYGADVDPTIPANTKMSDLTPEQMTHLMDSMRTREGWTPGQSTQEDKSPLANYSTGDRPDASAGGTYDPVIGNTPDAVYQDALTYLNDGPAALSGMGLGQANQVKNYRNAVRAQGAAIARKLGLDEYQARALFKANAKAAGSIVDRMGKIDTIGNTLTAQFPRLMQLADAVKAEGINVTEDDIQAGSAKALRKFGSENAAAYIELLQTIRGDYSSMQSALAGGRGGQFFAEQAQDALPLGLTSGQYRTIMETLQGSVKNATDATKSEAQNLLQGSGGQDQSSSNNSDSDYNAYLKAIGG